MVNLISQISTHQESQRIKVTVYHLYIGRFYTRGRIIRPDG